MPAGPAVAPGRPLKYHSAPGPECGDMRLPAMSPEAGLGGPLRARR